MNSQAADGDTTLNKAPADRETPSEEGPTELPLPSDPKSVFLGGLFILALLGAAYVARDIILPLIFACVLNLLLQPALRLLDQLHVPRTASALSLILVLLAMIVGLALLFRGPLKLGQPNCQKVSRDFRSASVSCRRPSIPFNNFYGR
jgi:hypothetical protein